jgi:RND family efflux transporter MFP subunit
MARKNAPMKLGLVACVVVAVGGGARSAAMRPVPVTVVTATKGTAVEAAYATATVESSARVMVRSRVAGTVVQIVAHEGDVVKKGQLLARLDATDVEADFERSQGDVAAARSEVVALEAELRSAREDRSRTTTLAQTSTISQVEANRVANGVDVLEARLAAANARVSALQGAMRSRATGGSQIQARDLEVRSPLDGVVLRREATQGDVVPARAPIFDVAELSELLVECVVDEADLGRVASGTRAVVSFRALPDVTYDGSVVEIARDANREKKSFIVKVQLDKMPAQVRNGMSAEVNLILARHEGAVLVAPGSVGGVLPSEGKRATSGEGPFVWVVQGGLAHKQAVTVGVRSPSAVEITSGVAPGDAVILDFDKLHEGSRVAATPLAWSWSQTY